jgi:transcriptional regulator with XRE-family HTH domain
MNENNKPNHRLTSNLCYLIQKNKLTYVDVAKGIGVSAELICKLRNANLNNPSLKVLIGLSRYFNITIEDLVFSDLSTVSISQSIHCMKYVPIVGWDNIEFWEKSNTSILVDTQNNVDFAIYMEAGYTELFPEQSSLLITKQSELVHNSLVLVHTIKTNAFHISQVIKEDDIYLQSLITKTVLKYQETEGVIFGIVLGYQKTKFFK